ncbi:VOC family protein [Streptococcus oralis]|uniref:VOC family protein n=1 Tax=Streptococcus oralis TaxID=1303 RepID=UPI00077D85B6|nr:VOC family protein [Streptococcus oralis]
MRNIKVKSLMSVFYVRDIDKSVEWYKKWLGEPDMIPMEGVAEYEMTSGAWLQLSQTENVVNSNIILGTDDIKECKKDLESVSIRTGEIIDYGVVYVLDVFDIDNNQISFVQEL